MRDKSFLDILDKRLLRVRLGLLGDVRSVGEGVEELKFQRGPGHRLYFAERGKNVILLICGGDKSTQQKDIRLAKQCWQDFKEGFQ